ncbi:MFS transporter [Amycolatopsis sp.]|uniref:MFS transporter n=1 Tax=Amycolatopsis sp. TaxID=37632 RepID=UPI002BDC75FD|nr:MFS transporter [Amycolatopsis sp.]HVV09817.1 MFS transporter [Amycolatopsis sp.]
MVHSPDRVVSVAAFGTFLAMMSFTAPLVTAQRTAADFGAGASGQTWLLSSMSLGLTVAMLTCGTLGDDYGRRRVFVAGTGVFVVASAVSALAPSVAVFVVARVLVGAGAAAMMACGLSMLGHALPPGPGRARASALWGASMGVGLAIGPVLAALCARYLDWRIVYWVYAALGVVLVLLARALLSESTSGRRSRIDVPGVVLLAAGLTCVLAGLTEGRGGWLSPEVLGLLVVGVLALGGFLVAERRSKAPMVDLSLFRRPALLSATAVGFASGAGINALMSYLPSLLQRGLGYSTLATAGLLLAWSAPSVLTSFAARYLNPGFPPRARMAVGLVLIAAGLLVTGGLSDGELCTGLIVAGVGTGLVNATIGGEAVTSVPPERSGMGSGINNTSRYLGAAVGVTVVFVLGVHSGHSGWAASVILGAAVSLAGALAVVTLRPVREVV